MSGYSGHTESKIFSDPMQAAYGFCRFNLVG